MAKFFTPHYSPNGHSPTQKHTNQKDLVVINRNTKFKFRRRFVSADEIERVPLR